MIQNKIFIKEMLDNLNNILADMHDGETDKNYPEEKCHACICQDIIQDINKLLEQ